MSAAVCPTCGATGREHCSTPSGRDHRARILAERNLHPVGSGEVARIVVDEPGAVDECGGADLVEQLVDVEADACRWDVRTPGLVDGMPAEVYHADPVPSWSLSSTGARDIWPQPGAPAKYLHLRDNPRPPKAAWTLGTALHTRILGTGAGYVVPVDEHGDPYVRWDTNRCKAQIDDIRAAGYVPLKADDALKVEHMADRILEHPDARALLEAAGRPEVSAFAQRVVPGFDDPVWLRCRYDWLPETDGGLLIFPDYKSAADASDDAVRKAMGSNGYHRQVDFYERVARLLGLAEQVVGVLIVQEKDPPYLVNVVQPHPDAIARARLLNDYAIELFARCRASGVWPGYSDAVHLLDVLPYQQNRETEALNGV